MTSKKFWQLIRLLNQLLEPVQIGHLALPDLVYEPGQPLYLEVIGFKLDDLTWYLSSWPPLWHCLCLKWTLFAVIPMLWILY